MIGGEGAVNAEARLIFVEAIDGSPRAVGLLCENRPDIFALQRAVRGLILELSLRAISHERHLCVRTILGESLREAFVLVYDGRQ